MSKARIYTMIVGSIILGILLGVELKTLQEKMSESSQNNAYEKLPRRRYVIVVDEKHFDEFFDQLENFASDQGFAIRIVPITPSGLSFSIEMWREDIKIFGANPFDTGEFRIGFYDTDSAYPYPAPESAFDNLANDLKNAVSKIPGATFSEE